MGDEIRPKKVPIGYNPLMHSQKVLPFWYGLALIVVAMVGLLVAHYVTRSTPAAVAFVVPIIELPVYWYGVVVMGALLFTTMAIAQMVHRRSVQVFERVVSAEIRLQPLSTLNLPEHINSQLQTQQITSVGQLLWLNGFNAKQIELAPADHKLVIETLSKDGFLPPLPLGEGWGEAFFSWRMWNPDYVWGSVMWALVLGIIGARLYHVLTPQPSLGITPTFYFANPAAIFNLRNGGLGIFGAIAGGALGLWLYVRWQQLPFADWIDLGALVGALAQAIGRWANYFNQELFGAPTNLPWGIYIDPPFRPNGMADVVRYHPTFLYESIWSFGTFFLLYWLWRGEKMAAGEVAAVYLILYGFGRILLETIRLDSNTTGGIATASLVSGGMIVIGVVGILWMWGKGLGNLPSP